MQVQIGRLSHSSIEEEAGFQSDELVDPANGHIQSFVAAQRLLIEDPSFTISLNVRKWKNVVFAGLFVTLTGGGLILGGVIAGNPWLVAIGTIIAIAGLIILGISIKKCKDGINALKNQIPQVEEMLVPLPLSRAGSQASFNSEGGEFDEGDDAPVEDLGIPPPPRLSREASNESAGSIGPQGSGLAALEITSPSSTTNSAPSESSSPVEFREVPWSPLVAKLRLGTAGLSKKEN